MITGNNKCLLKVVGTPIPKRMLRIHFISKIPYIAG